MLEFMLKTITLALAFIVWIPTIVWFYRHGERHITNLVDRFPKTMTGIAALISITVWLAMGWAGFVSSPRDTADEIAQWGGRVMFIVLPMIFLFIVRVMTYKPKAVTR